MSHLEKVPTELLVEIFLYSMNMDLPRSSPVIGAKLSSELIYTRTVIAAFGSTWHDGYGECKLRSNALWSYAISKHFPVLVDPKDDDAAVGALQVSNAHPALAQGQCSNPCTVCYLAMPVGVFGYHSKESRDLGSQTL